MIQIESRTPLFTTDHHTQNPQQNNHFKIIFLSHIFLSKFTKLPEDFHDKKMEDKKI